MTELDALNTAIKLIVVVTKLGGLVLRLAKCRAYSPSRRARPAIISAKRSAIS